MAENCDIVAAGYVNINAKRIHSRISDVFLSTMGPELICVLEMMWANFNG